MPHVQRIAEGEVLEEYRRAIAYIEGRQQARHSHRIADSKVSEESSQGHDVEGVDVDAPQKKIKTVDEMVWSSSGWRAKARVLFRRKFRDKEDTPINKNKQNEKNRRLKY